MWIGKIIPLIFVLVVFCLTLSGLLSAFVDFTNIGSNDDSSSRDPGICEPIAAGGCLYPWPSMHFLSDDNKTDTKKRLSIPMSAMPLMKEFKRIDPKYWNEHDGYSVMTPMMFDIPNAKQLAFDRKGTLSTFKTMETQSNTAIICIDTGELVHHFAEIDSLAEKGERPLVLINPMEPLQFNKSYMAVVRNMYDVGDKKIAPPVEGFLSAVQEKGRLSYFNSTLMPLITSLLGWKQSEIQLAWDWHTYSRRSALGRIEAMRDVAANWSLKYNISCVQEADCQKIDPKNSTHYGRVIWGTFEVPYFMSGYFRGSPLVVRPNEDLKGLEKRAVNRTVEFVVGIPCSVLNDGGAHPATLVQAGHTFFENIREVADSSFGFAANRNKWVMFSTDWYGMCSYDVLHALSLFIGHQSDMETLSEMIMQAHVNHVTLARLVREELIHQAPFQDENRTRPLYDPSSLFYYGISQGSILGSAYAALSTEVKRAALTVPGTSIQFIASRSTHFTLFLRLLRCAFFTPKDIRLFTTLFGFIMEPAEGAGWLTSMVEHPGPKNHAKPVLLVSDIGDPQVTEIGAQVMARAYKAHTVAPQTRHIPYIDELPPGFVDQSAIIEWRYNDTPPCPDTNIPADGFDTHTCPPYEVNTTETIRIFFENGTVTNQCDGICLRDHHCTFHNVLRLKKGNCTDRFCDS